ncbi:MAG: hypothetical protein [aquatic viral metagenome]
MDKKSVSSVSSLQQVTARLQELGQSAVPVPVETVTVEAVITNLDGLEVMARVFHEELLAALGSRYTLSQAEVLDALKFVVELRVYQVRRETPGSVDLRTVEFPAALLPIVLAIGVVNIDRVIEIIPALGSRDGTIINFSTWAQSLEERLGKLEALVRYLSAPDLRVEMAVMPRDISGSLDFYAFVLDGSDLRTDRSTRDRVMAVFRSVLRLTLSPWVWGRPVWSYGTIDLLKQEIRAFTRNTIRGRMKVQV